MRGSRRGVPLTPQIRRAPAERLVLIHPGAQLPSRRWSAERFAAVADNLAAEGWQIAITGTAAEASVTGGVLGAMTAPALHLAGATSLGGLAAIVSEACLVVCNDTGISHIAAAVATASVVIASGSDTRRWARSTTRCTACSPTIPHAGPACSANALTVIRAR
jgi:ADP-heptose:LPS heptosyltransferase